MLKSKVEGLICPACSSPIPEEDLAEKLECPSCKKKLKQKKYLAFLEFLMMQGIVNNIDFFDEKLYGDEIKKEEETSEELSDETNPDEYEDLKEKFEKYEDEMGVEDNSEEEDETSEDDWKTIDEDWQEFNRRHREEDEKNNNK